MVFTARIGLGTSVVSLLGLFLAGTAACTTSTSSAPSAPAATADAGDQGAAASDEDAGTDDAAPPADVCGAVKASKCKPANEGSVVRGVVTFDPSKVKTVAGTTPKLRVFLHHQVILKADENKTGGHPHAWGSFPIDMAKGEASFSIDLCEFGTAMYSEENCGFNIVALIDVDGQNDPDQIGAPALIPRDGQLVKMAPVDVSCHKPSNCLQMTLDCVDGDKCTTYDAPTKCATCAADSCPSDDQLCKL